MPRIAPLVPPYPPDVQHSFDRVMPPGVPALALFRTLATSPRAWAKFQSGALLDRGPLPLRDRELVIDRTCARAACGYEWGVHVAYFAERAALTPEQVRATATDSADVSCWAEHERALLAAVDALHERATLTPAEFARLRGHYDDTQVLEILMLAGYYRMVAYVANALDLPQEPGTPRLPGLADVGA